MSDDPRIQAVHSAAMNLDAARAALERKACRAFLVGARVRWDGLEGRGEGVVSGVIGGGTVLVHHPKGDVSIAPQNIVEVIHEPS